MCIRDRTLTEAGLKTDAAVRLVGCDVGAPKGRSRTVQFDPNVQVNLVGRLELADIVGEPREPDGQNPCWYNIAQGRARRLEHFGAELESEQMVRCLAVWHEVCCDDETSAGVWWDDVWLDCPESDWTDKGKEWGEENSSDEQSGADSSDDERCPT
eukprot:TRINITY_DN39157_c0_g1_i1.p1 TRINITY_DN39157_c0_g1~~TRINITY_DN39157_c0_g1_i1.p1  ORF type:complete len:156 (-),score=26.30 TRINITY_DN39157_c0_g1_i1:303-770(-)